MTTSSRRHPISVCVALSLLLLQSVGGGAVALAHARDPIGAPVAVEASHNARCVVLHDALRCALCHYAATRVAVQHAVVSIPVRAVRLGVSPAARSVVVAGIAHFTPPSRAPPPLS